ncbi:MAG TPA: hypothetical protein PLN33_08755 [Hyphomonadaceae bacterium]|jgi:hypothetical protein|nr:hypothetical protein [Hyphomonadaceae bacterium]HPN06959.1 hypothetical protein [Hyphomonadaceae bacterium]
MPTADQHMACRRASSAADLATKAAYAITTQTTRQKAKSIHEKPGKALRIMLIFGETIFTSIKATIHIAIIIVAEAVAGSTLALRAVFKPYIATPTTA